MALARPSVDVGLEPYTPAGTSGALVALGVESILPGTGAFGAGSCLGQDLPREPAVTALLSCAACALPTKPAPVPQSQNQSLAGRCRPGAFL